MAGRLWTSYELLYLKENYSDTPTTDIAEKLNRTEKAVYSQAKLIDLKKSDEYLKKFVFTIDAELGKSTRFKKGQKAHNKGEKMRKDVYSKCAPTMFKKGQTPHNTLADGVISIRTDKNGTKRPFIRVALGNWVEMKNHIWQEANGPIPKGHCVALKDGDPFNYELSNLECITRKENMLRNTIHNYPEEIKSTIRTISKLNKTIKRHG